MADYSVTHVRYSSNRFDIERVKLVGGNEAIRGWVVTQIEQAKRTFITAPPSGKVADVHVVRGQFLSTDPNETKRDNLGNLPEF